MKSPESSPAAQPQQEPAEPFIPTKYRNLSADVVEELWTERFFTDPKKTEQESKNRKAALDFLRAREASEDKSEATESTQKEQSWKAVSSEMQLSAEGAAAEKQKVARTATDKSQEDTVRRSLGMQSTGEQVTSAPPELAETSAEGGKYLNVPEAAKQLGEWVDKELVNYFSKPDAPEPKKLGYVPLEAGEQQLLRTIKTEFLKAAQQVKAAEFSVRTFVFHGMSPEAFENYETLTFKAKSRTLHGEMWQSLSEPEKKGFPERQKQAAEVFTRMQKGEEFLDFGLTEVEQELIDKARIFAKSGENKLQPKDKVVYENLIQKVAYLLTRNPASSEFFTQRDQLVYENFVQKSAYTLTKTPKLRDLSLVSEKLEERPAALRETPKPAPERIQQKEEGVRWQEVVRVSEQEAIGDLNGSYESFVAHLTERGLIESTGGKIEWRGGNKRVVFVGDILGDRSPSGLKTMEALARLNVEAQKQGGSVESLAGNHDNMFTAVLGGFDLQDTIKVEDAGIFQYTGTLESAFYADRKFKEYIRERFNAVYEEQKLDLKKTIATRAANLTRIQGQGSDAKTVKNFQDYLAKAQGDLVKLEDMHANMNLDDEEQFMAMLALLPNSDAEAIGKALVQGREAVLTNMKASESGRERLEAACTQKIATLIDDTLYTHTNLTGEMVQEILKGKTAKEGIQAVNELYQKGLRYFLLGEGQLTSEEKKKFDVLRTMFIPTTDESRINFTESSALSSDVRQQMEKELKRKGINLAIHGHNEENGKVLGTSELPIVSIDRSAYKSGLNKNPISSLTVERNGNVLGKATLQPVREGGAESAVASPIVRQRSGEQNSNAGNENAEERRESGESLVVAIGELKNLDTQSLQLILREIDFTTLAEALIRQPEGVRTTVLGAISNRAATTVTEEMEHIPADADFERAEREVLMTARKVLAEIAERIRKEKNKKWEETRKQIEQITYATGRGIDEGIKETVVAFNVNEIPTSQSCEGHEEVEGGHRPWPWVEVAAPDEPEERFVGEAEAFVKAAQENNVPLDELKKGHPEEVYWKLRQEVSQNPLTPEYRAWEKKNVELHSKVKGLLYEFYNDRKAEAGIKLEAEDTDGNSFEISSEGEALNKFLNNELTDDERKILLDKLPARRKEMQDFTEFLKSRFLGGEKTESRESQESPIEALESSSLETIQKFDLAQLLVSEQRKAAHLGNADVIESDEHRKQLEREFGEEYKATAELLTKLGLSFEGEPPHEDNGIYRFSFVVARDTENLAKAVEADKTNNDKEFGVLMGYPKTAVDAYQTENAFDLRAELPKEELEELEKEEVLAFLEFMPSKGHWKEELDEVRETQRLIKEQAPKLYDEVIEWRKKEAQESVEYDIPADAEMLVEYAKANFGKFAEADSNSFKEIWTEADADHFKQYMDVSIRTMLKDASSAEAGEDRVKDLCRTTEEKIILQRLMVESGGSAIPLDEFDRQPFSKVVREALGIDVEETEGGYYKHFMKR